MKFGKVSLDALNDIDFTIPDFHIQSFQHLNSTPSKKCTIRLGATGWSTKEWKGVIYPEQAKPNEFLHHYAKSYDTIELNSTHYRIPKKQTVQSWKDDVGSSFKFCPKVLQTISHSKALGLDTERIKLFCDAIALFEDNLGTSFMQLPPHWAGDQLPILQAFLDQWPSELPLAIEVRNASFFENDDIYNQYFDLLEEYDVDAVITDVAGARFLMHMRLTTPSIFVRFVGNDLHHTDYERIDEWSEILCFLSKLGLESAYFFPHEPDNINPPQITEYMIHKINSIDETIELRQILWTNRDNQLLLF